MGAANENTAFIISGINAISLATDAQLIYPVSETNNASEHYRSLSENIFQIPRLPGYVYGTGNQVNDVKVCVTLAYKAGSETDREVCEVSYNVDITRKVSISPNDQVVVDGEKFNPEDMITVENADGKNLTFYNDTLEYTVPGNSTVKFDVVFTGKELATNKDFTRTKTVEYTNINSKVETRYVSLSSIYNQQNGESEFVNTKFTIDNVVASKGGVIRYGQTLIYHNGYNKTKGSTLAEATDERPDWLKSGINIEKFIKNSVKDALYIEDVAALTGESKLVDRWYVIGVGSGTDAKYYRYQQSFNLYRRWSSIDLGVGIDISKTFSQKNGNQGGWERATSEIKDEHNNVIVHAGDYKLPFSVWANNMSVTDANGETKYLASTDNTKAVLSTDDLKSLRFEVSNTESETTACFVAVKDNNGKITGYDLYINQKYKPLQHISIYIYVKVSGGYEENFLPSDTNMGVARDKLLNVNKDNIGFLILLDGTPTED